MQNPDILNLPGWRVVACEASEDRYVIQARPCCLCAACPDCGSSAIAKHGKDAQTLYDLPCHGKQVTISYDRQRFRCTTCRKTWFEVLPEVAEQHRTTVRLVRYVKKQALVRTFVAIAAETGLDERSVRNLFHDSLAELERMTPRPIPRVLGLDEIHLLGTPRAVLTDLEAKRIVEILPERKKESIMRYLAVLPAKDTVQLAVIDMHRPYLEALREQLPQARIIIDKWHVLRVVNQIVDDTRKAIRAKLSDRQRRALMHDRFILLKRHQDLTAQQLLLLESWLGQFPRLEAVYWRKEEFYQIYEARDLEEATTRYITWEDRIAQSGIYDAYLEFLLTIEHWGDYIFNYFTHRYTGAFVEGANSLVRSVDRQGRGYSFAVLRARLLYGQHLLRQTRKPKPKVSDALEVMSVDDQVGNALPSTPSEVPVPL